MSEPDRSTQSSPVPEGAPVVEPIPAIRRLLVPLDGSVLAEAALPIATGVADACHAMILLLHAVEKGAPARIHGDRHLTSRQEAEAYLAQLTGKLATEERQVEYHVHEVPVGDVSTSIAYHAEEREANLIILGTHGEGGIRDALWGSIAQQVLHRSTRPVLLVRSHGGVLTPSFAPRTIMVPLDATAAAEAALPFARVLSYCLKAQLRLVVVVATPDSVTGEQQAIATFLPSTTRVLLDEQEAQATVYLERLAAALRPAGITVLTEVRRGDPVTQLATDAGEHADGLVVVATHGRAGLQAIWSPSVAARLLKRTQAPILLVPIVEGDHIDKATGPA